MERVSNSKSVNVRAKTIRRDAEVCTKEAQTPGKGQRHIDPRPEEAKDQFYRIPPPGNGPGPLGAEPNYTQNRIDQYWAHIDEVEQLQEPAIVRGNQNINILQWNAQSLNTAKAQELSEHCKENDIDILCVSELGFHRKIPGFKCVAQSGIHSEAAVYARNNLPATRIDNTPELSRMSKLGILTQRVTIDNAFTLIHTYITPNVSTPNRKAYWKDIEKDINRAYRLNTPIVILGDLNTHSPRFCENHRDHITNKYFDDMLDAQNMLVLNNGEPTRNGNALDAAIANEAFSNKVHDWQVIDDLNSDHLPTQIRTNFKATTNREPRPTAVRTVIDEQATVAATIERIKQAKDKGEYLGLDRIQAIAREATVTKVIRNEAALFWNEDLKALCKARNRAKTRKKRNRNPALQDELDTIYNHALKCFSSEFKQAKKQWQKQQVLEAANEPMSKKLWQLLKKLRPSARGKKAMKWSVKTNTATDQVNRIATKFANISNDPELATTAAEAALHTQLIAELKQEDSGFEEVSIRELRARIKKSKDKSAPGTDGRKDR